jgi:hypothetical protein
MATLIPSFKIDNPFEPINDNELIGLTFNDNAGPASNILWSSSKIKQLIPSCPENFQEKQPNALANNLAKFGSEADQGQVIDSGMSVNDSSPPDPNVLWSSQKIANIPLPPFQMKQPEAVKGDIAIFGSDVDLGQVIDSGFSINDSSLPSPNVLWSSNQIQSQILAISQAKQPSAVFGNLASFGNGSNNGQCIDSGFLINDSLAPAANVLYSSSKVQQLQQLSFLSSPSPVPGVPGSAGILYVGVDGSSYVWNGLSYNGVLAKAYAKFISQSPLSVPSGSVLSIPLPITQYSGESSSGSISIDANGLVSILSSSQAPCLYKASFSGQGLNAASLQASFAFFDSSNSQIGNSSSAFSFNSGSVPLSSQCSLEEFFLVPPQGQVQFSVKISTKASDPPVSLGNSGASDNPYLIVEQLF